MIYIYISIIIYHTLSYIILIELISQYVSNMLCKMTESTSETDLKMFRLRHVYQVDLM